MTRPRTRGTTRADAARASARAGRGVEEDGARAGRGVETDGALGRDADAQKLAELDTSLLDIVDHVLTKGIVLTGDLVLGVADIDLVYLRLSAVLCAADRVLGPSAKRRRSTTARSIAQKMGRPRLTPKPR